MASRTVLITGAAKGIGAAAAAAFAEKGYNIVLHSNTSDISKTLSAVKSLGVSAAAVSGDLTDESSLKNIAKEAVSVFCGLDVLVNNAGIMLWKLFSKTTKAEWQNILDVNITAPAMLTKEILPHMIQKGHGSIVNVSSVWGETGASMEVAYSASKAAVIGFTKALAKELAPSGITVNTVAPGAAKTDMLNHMTEDGLSAFTSDIPLSRIAAPEEIASTILFIAEQPYITGQVLGVNGGANI